MTGLLLSSIFFLVFVWLVTSCHNYARRQVVCCYEEIPANCAGGILDADDARPAVVPGDDPNASTTEAAAWSALDEQQLAPYLADKSH